MSEGEIPFWKGFLQMRYRLVTPFCLRPFAESSGFCLVDFTEWLQEELKALSPFSIFIFLSYIPIFLLKK